MSRALKKKWERERYAAKFLQEEIVDIKTTAQTFALIKPFAKVQRVMFSFQWTAINIELDLFAGDSALTNGLNILYDDGPIFATNIKTNWDIKKRAYDLDPFTDGAATKISSIVSRYSFWKIVPNGLDLSGRHSLKVKTEDNLSLIANSLLLIFEGWMYGHD